MVTTETIVSLKENRERLDSAKAATKARKLPQLLDSLSLTSKQAKPLSPSTKPPPKSKKKRVQAVTKAVQNAINSGKESTDWEDGNDSDGSIYWGPSQMAAGTTSGVMVEGLGSQGTLLGVDGNTSQTDCAMQEPSGIYILSRIPICYWKSLKRFK
ncbi:hypothetical protein C7212DRAFT_348079 [Tuber magnatum]|uniref:Uncharacterized protein n=1 Tax=Tuber magnatum TaxID=42249 RepID=A0A317SCW9_9PEZI|nr:hypothetical protein C7212DRAFT_348079 [Tuber magnatum]